MPKDVSEGPKCGGRGGLQATAWAVSVWFLYRGAVCLRVPRCDSVQCRLSKYSRCPPLVPRRGTACPRLSGQALAPGLVPWCASHAPHPGICLRGRGGFGGNFRTATEQLQGVVKAVGGRLLAVAKAVGPPPFKQFCAAIHPPRTAQGQHRRPGRVERGAAHAAPPRPEDAPGLR